MQPQALGTLLLFWQQKWSGIWDFLPWMCHLKWSGNQNKSQCPVLSFPSFLILPHIKPDLSHSLRSFWKSFYNLHGLILDLSSSCFHLPIQAGMVPQMSVCLPHLNSRPTPASHSEWHWPWASLAGLCDAALGRGRDFGISSQKTRLFFCPCHLAHQCELGQTI